MRVGGGNIELKGCEIERLGGGVKENTEME